MPSSPSLLHQHLLIRSARDDDAAALHRLAALDSRRTPRKGQVLVAEADGQLQAALATGDGHAVANPFLPTANLVAMLRARARMLRQS